MQLVLTLGVVALNSALGLAVFMANKKRLLNIAFRILALSLIGWTVSNYLADNTLVAAGALFWVRASFGFAFVIGGSILMFSNLLAGDGRMKKWKAAAIGGSSAAMFAISFTPAIVSAVEMKSWGANTINGPLFVLFPAYLLVTVFWGLGKLIWRYRLVSGLQRRQIRLFLIGIAGSFAVGVTMNLILPLLTGSTSLAKYGPYGTVLLVVMTSVAIVRHELLDIRPLVLKSVAYLAWLAAVAFVYVLGTFAVLQRLSFIAGRTAMTLVTLVVLLLTFGPLTAFLEKRTDRLFSRGRYDFNELLSRLNAIAKDNSRNVVRLTGEIMAVLAEEMKVGAAAFVLDTGARGVRTRKIGRFANDRTSWERLLHLARESESIIIYELLEDGTDLKRELRRAGVSVLLPVRTEHSTLAALALGEKRSGEQYATQDISVLELMAPQWAIAFENASLFRDREQRIGELRAINKLFHHIEHFLSLDRLLQKVVDEAIGATKADGGSLMLYDAGSKTLAVKTSRNLPPIVALNAKVKLGEGIAGLVAETRHPLIVDKWQKGPIVALLRREEVGTAISVPMMAEHKLVGVLNVSRQSARSPFTKENLNLLSAFAAQAAEAIVKTGYYEQVEKLSLENDTQFKEFTRALAKTVDAKDPYTYGHSEGVTRYALAIGREMGLDNMQLRELEIAGRLHDMGKIGIPEHILNKPGPLTDEEFGSVRRHPEIAAAILKDTKSLAGIRDLILYHHERFDGTGYPANLKGEAIPLGARILAVADAFDTITSHRSYRPALPMESAIVEIRECRGTHFDPTIADAFLRLAGRSNFKVIGGGTKRASSRVTGSIASLRLPKEAA